jgi:hypothetical protein
MSSVEEVDLEIGVFCDDGLMIVMEEECLEMEMGMFRVRRKAKS